MLSAVVPFLAAFLAGAKSQCPEEWTAYVHADKCIKAFHEQFSFFDALAFCEAHGSGNDGTLVSIHSAFQNAHLGSLAQKLDSNCSFWIGLDDFDTSVGYQWTDGSAADFFNWVSGYPNGNPDETAVIMNIELRNHWEETTELSASFCFFCQQNSIQASETVTVSLPATVAATTTTKTTAVPETTRITVEPTSVPIVQYTCYEGDNELDGQWCFFGGDSDDLFLSYEAALRWCFPFVIASIHSEEENQVIQMVAKYRKIWIGLRKFGDKLYWYDQSPVDFTKFESDFVPSNGSHIVMKEDGFWTGKDDCSEGQYDNYPNARYVCKYKALETILTCQGTTTSYAGRGLLRSPGFPKKYSGSFDCKYQLEAESGYYIIINLYSYSYCKNNFDSGDWFEIYDGWKEDPQKLLFHCYYGCETFHLVQSISNRMLIVFKGKSCGMWKATWYSTKSVAANFSQGTIINGLSSLQHQIGGDYIQCPITSYSFDNMKAIYSPNYPLGYNANFDCIYYFNGTGMREIMSFVVYIGDDDYFEVIDLRTNTIVASTKDVLFKVGFRSLDIPFDFAVRFHSGSDYYVLNQYDLEVYTNHVNG